MNILSPIKRIDSLSGSIGDDTNGLNVFIMTLFDHLSILKWFS